MITARHPKRYRYVRNPSPNSDLCGVRHRRNGRRFSPASSGRAGSPLAEDDAAGPRPDRADVGQCDAGCQTAPRNGKGRRRVRTLPPASERHEHPHPATARLDSHGSNNRFAAGAKILLPRPSNPHGIRPLPEQCRGRFDESTARSNNIWTSTSPRARSDVQCAGR